MTSLISIAILGVVLLISIVFPSSIVASGMTPSTGVFLIAIAYALIFLPIGSVRCRAHFALRFFFLVIGFFLAIFFHGILCLLINEVLDFHRFVSSFAYLIFFVLGAFSFALFIDRLKSVEVEVAVKFVFYLLVLTGIVAVCGYSPWFATEKPVFFFSEPSHFALVFLPFLLCVMMMGRMRMRIVLLLGAFLLGVFLENLTLLIGVLTIVLLVFGVRKLLYLVTLVAVLIALLSPGGVRYYLARLDLSPESTNLSVLVYLNGWERAYLNLKESNGLGIGFNQLGVSGTSGEMAERLTHYAGKELNRLDGGFVAGKLISELGMAGIVLLAMYLVGFVSGARRLHRLAVKWREEKDGREVFFLSCYLMFFIDLFVRGTGYFSSASFLLVAAVIWMVFARYQRAANTVNGVSQVCG